MILFEVHSNEPRKYSRFSTMFAVISVDITDLIKGFDWVCRVCMCDLCMFMFPVYV